ncbi:MAG: signal recognition particle-docking protein FtsY [Candidatus Gastranaerophilales bacterium]|nr:signal recognition particle-docking protein FtsY [Candidatus Gastranaerophilales bacterium]
MFNFFKKKEENNENKAQNQGFGLLKNALANTANSLIDSVVSVVTGDSIPDEFELDDIESMLIKADLGIDLATELVEKIKEKRIKSSQLKDFLKQEFVEILNLESDNKLKFNKEKLNVYFVVGVNGAGKTTLIGKLANRFKEQGERVLLVAGDTFRAAAEEQLDVWSKRANVDILREDKADSASLAYRSIDMARKDGYNVVIIDSAGRLQNKFNLIEELKKIKNVIYKKIENDNLETLLVLDGSQGQNGLNQALVFNEAVDITALAITKLDGTPKGGIIFSIAKNLKLPTKLIGIGEGINDIIDFNKADFINALFE